MKDFTSRLKEQAANGQKARRANVFKNLKRMLHKYPKDGDAKKMLIIMVSLFALLHTEDCLTSLKKTDALMGDQSLSTFNTIRKHYS